MMRRPERGQHASHARRHETMSATGLEVFDETLHKTNAWLKAVMQALGPGRH